MGVVKAFHVIAVLIWMGSLFTVSHLLAIFRKEAPQVQERLAQILFRMYHFIQLPFMMLAVTLGLVLLAGVDLSYKPGWFHMKLFFVMCLIVCDLFVGRMVMAVSRQDGYLPAKGLRAMHSVMGIFLIGVTISLYVVRDREGELIRRMESGQAAIKIENQKSLAEMPS